MKSSKLKNEFWCPWCGGDLPYNFASCNCGEGRDTYQFRMDKTSEEPIHQSSSEEKGKVREERQG